MAQHKIIIDLMISRRDDIKPVSEIELVSFIKEHHIFLCDDYIKFILNYGYSKHILCSPHQYADFTFSEFKDFYLDNELFDDLSLPDSSNYIGIGFGGESLCIDHKTGTIQPFYYGKKDIVCYEGVDGLLFHCLLSSSEYKLYFDNINILELNDQNQFLTYEISELKNIYSKYFIHNNDLMILNRNSNKIICLSGGIMNYL